MVEDATTPISLDEQINRFALRVGRQCKELSEKIEEYRSNSEGQVKYSETQNLTLEQKGMARANIAAVSSEEVNLTVSTIAGAMVEELREEISGAIGGGGPSGVNAVLYTPQELTDEQKAQAKANIGVAEIDTSSLIPKTGDRGLLNGYQQAGILEVGGEGEEGVREGVPDDAFVATEDRVTVYASRLPDISTIDVTDPAKTLTILPAENRTEACQGWWTKIIRVGSASEIIEFKALEGNAGDLQFSYPWCWDQGEVPEITSGDYLVMFWTGGLGIVKKLPAYFTE